MNDEAPATSGYQEIVLRQLIPTSRDAE